MHSPSPTVSVIIPCYNSEEYIERAINSVLNQTYTDYEIIIVDNGSTDTTITILYEYQNKYAAFIKVLHEDKKGAPAARNKGLAEARGAWIQFLDSDDELLPHKLEYQVAFTKGTDTDLIIGNCYKYRFINNQLHKWIVYAEDKNIWKGLLSSRLGNTCANLWKKETLLSVNGWNEKMHSSQEYELLFRLLKKNIHIQFAPRPLLIVHMREDSIVRSTNKDRLCEILETAIRLRLAIKEHLQAEGKLTNELNLAINSYIYFRLFRYRNVVPDYVSKKLKETDIRLPFTLLLQHYFKIIKNKIRLRIKSKLILVAALKRKWRLL